MCESCLGTIISVGWSYSVSMKMEQERKCSKQSAVGIGSMVRAILKYLFKVEMHQHKSYSASLI